LDVRSSLDLISFDTAERRTLAIKKRFDLRAGSRQTRHHGADRHALNLCDLTIGKALQHNKQQRRPLIRAPASGPAMSGASSSPNAINVGRRASERNRFRFRLVKIV
jgi:hypothetical protein